MMTILDGEERAVSPSDPKIRVMRKSDAYLGRHDC